MLNIKKKHSSQMWRQGLGFIVAIFLGITIWQRLKNQHLTRIAICQKIHKSIFYIRLFSSQMAQNPYNCQKYEIKEFELVATFKLPVATCGERRQG